MTHTPDGIKEGDSFLLGLEEYPVTVVAVVSSFVWIEFTGHCPSWCTIGEKFPVNLDRLEEVGIAVEKDESGMCKAYSIVGELLE